MDKPNDRTAKGAAKKKVKVVTKARAAEAKPAARPPAPGRVPRSSETAKAAPPAGKAKSRPTAAPASARSSRVTKAAPRVPKGGRAVTTSPRGMRRTPTANDVPGESLTISRGTAPLTGLEVGAPVELEGDLPLAFPMRYDADRVRLLVRDPEWLFVHWEVSRRSMEALRQEIGEHTLQLSRLTLRLSHGPGDIAGAVVLLPREARGWYLRVAAGHRRYHAELGLTLPSGEFRSLAWSNTVTFPWIGASAEAAGRTIDYRAAWRSPGVIPTGAALASADAAMADAGPVPERVSVGTSADLPVVPRPVREWAGASDRFQP